jgi:hypothetical protein
LGTPAPRARTLLHGGNKVVQREEEWEDDDCAEFGSELDGLHAIDEEYDCRRLSCKPDVGLRRSLGMAERPGVEDEHVGSRLGDGIGIEPGQHIHRSNRAPRIH